MDIDTLRKLCNDLPAVTEGIKWGNDLCFMIGEKMFCVTSLDAPLKVSFKVMDEEFDELSSRPGIVPAPYVARHKWVLVEKADVFSTKHWKHYISQSYNLVRAKLSKKILAQLK